LFFKTATKNLQKKQCIIDRTDEKKIQSGGLTMYFFEEERLTRAEKIQKREEEILNIIKDYWAKHNHSPSIREIVRKSSVKSNSTVMNYLYRLKEKGLIDWQPKKPRTFLIKEKTPC
jgi:sulfur relay (sulfurtransferase) DsrC/TusE family protein